jgi:hypothetical protein
MLVGDEHVFAIDSHVEELLASRSLIGIGYFNILLAGTRFGVKDQTATALACSYDNIVNRIQMRDQHVTPFPEIQDPHLIAHIFRDVLYVKGEDGTPISGHARKGVIDTIYKNKLLFAPDGDEAFADGSYVIHFDVGAEVRLIGFFSGNDEYYEKGSLVDVRLSADEFYNVLESWRVCFAREAGIL